MKSEIAFNVIMIGLAMYFLRLSSAFTGISKYDTIGPGFWPTVILSILLGLSVILLVLNLKKGKAKVQADDQKSNISIGKFILSLVAAFGYFFVMHYVGFILATLAFQLVFLLIQGVRKVKILAGTPFILTGILFVLFIKLMYLPLPKGIGVFHYFSLLFY